MTETAVGDIRPSGLLVTPSWHVLRQQVLHLAQFSGGVQIICAKKGGGKSSLLTLIKEEAPDYFYDLGMGEGLATLELLVTIADKLGLPSEQPSSVGEQLSSLRSYSQSLEKESRRVILAIDDAQNLLDGDLAALISVLQGHPDTGFGLHFLLFAEPGLAERIDKLQLLDVYVHDVQVPPFSCNEIQNLLEAQGRLSEDLEFTDSEIQTVWHRSGGLPGRAIELSKHLHPSQASSNDDKKPHWPWSHMAAILVLVLILSWAVFFRGESDEGITSEQVANNIGEDVPQPEQVISEGPRMPNDALSATSNKEPIVEILEPEDHDETEVKKGGQAANDYLRAAPESTANQVDADKFEPVTPDPSLSAKEISTKDVEVDQGLEQNVHKPSKDKVAGSGGSLLESNRLASKTGLEALSDKEFLKRNQAELMGFSSNGYVLQIMAISQLPKLRAFWASQPNKEHLRVYQTERNNKRLYILVEGFYADRGSALAAIPNLPTVQSKGGPWPKRLSEIRTDMVRER